MDIKKWIISEFKRRGFKKDGRVYKKTLGSADLYVSTHKSRFSDEFFIDCGAVLSEFPVTSNQYSIYWHVFARIDRIPADGYDKERTSAALDGEIQMDDEERIKIISASLDEMERLMENSLSDRHWIISNAPRKHFGGLHFNDSFVEACAGINSNIESLG